jgi:small subunit ribosomal protein S11
MQVQKTYKMLKKLNKKYTSLVAIAYVYTTFNNTLITITNIKGTSLIFGSTGFLGLKGAARGTSYAGQSIASFLGKKIFGLGIKFLQIRIKGFGNSRKFLLKGFTDTSLKIISIKDFSSLAHNGCRKKKKKRI